MKIGKAVAIFYEIKSDKYSDVEKFEAINIVADMATHNSVTKDAMLRVIRWLAEPRQSESERIVWNEVYLRPVNDEDREVFTEIELEGAEGVFVCALPDDGEEVLVQTKFGVDTDTFVRDEYGCGGENYDDWENIIAWAKMPKGMKRAEDEQ